MQVVVFSCVLDGLVLLGVSFALEVLEVGFAEKRLGTCEKLLTSENLLV